VVTEFDVRKTALCNAVAIASAYIQSPNGINPDMLKVVSIADAFERYLIDGKQSDPVDGMQSDPSVMRCSLCDHVEATHTRGGCQHNIINSAGQAFVCACPRNPATWVTATVDGDR
jgi:hypothetical protein